MGAGFRTTRRTLFADALAALGPPFALHTRPRRSDSSASNSRKAIPGLQELFGFVEIGFQEHVGRTQAGDGAFLARSARPGVFAGSSANQILLAIGPAARAAGPLPLEPLLVRKRLARWPLCFGFVGLPAYKGKARLSSQNRQARGPPHRNGSVPPSSNAGFQPAKSSASSTVQSSEGRISPALLQAIDLYRHSRKGLEQLRCYSAWRLAHLPVFPKTGRPEARVTGTHQSPPPVTQASSLPSRAPAPPTGRAIVQPLRCAGVRTRANPGLAKPVVLRAAGVWPFACLPKNRQARALSVVRQSAA